MPIACALWEQTIQSSKIVNNLIISIILNNWTVIPVRKTNNNSLLDYESRC